MKKCLYFICPTDYLESIIEGRFQQKKYFYSSLGNSVTFGEHELRQIMKLIKTKNIREISFILADDNRIVLDALGNKDFSYITGLNNFYDQVIMQRAYLEMSWKIRNPQFFMLSYFLNNKIEELRKGLSDSMIDHITINAKIYRKKDDKFDELYTVLICQKDFSLN